MGALFAPSASAAPTTASRRSEPQYCQGYIPLELELSAVSAAPAEKVGVKGLAYPGDTVTISMTQEGSPSIVLATAVADSNGVFASSITVPPDTVEGVYRIPVLSPSCASESVVSLVVRYPAGECSDHKDVSAKAGESVKWVLLGDLDTTKSLTVTLVPDAGGPSVVVHTGAYPSGGAVDLAVPTSLAAGSYHIVESGTGSSGVALSARCGELSVKSASTTGATTSTTTPGAVKVVTPTSVALAVAGEQVTKVGSNEPAQVEGASTSRSGGSNLAVTGSTVRPLIVTAAALIGVGALFALSSRRRRAR
jgi:uncharacterized Zn-binding protein involved in type VI secretion